MQSLAMVVMEPGSEWPPHLNRQDADVVVFGQARGEPDEALIRRVRERIELRGEGLELAVLACNKEKNEEARDRRGSIAQALLDGVLRARRGHLIFSAGAGASPGLQQQLLALTSTVLEGLGTSSACVSVRFQSVSSPKDPRSSEVQPRSRGPALSA